MLALLHRIEKKHLTWLVNALVFLFFISVLTFKKGYSYAPMALAVIGIIYLFHYLFKQKKKLNPTLQDKWLIYAFVFYFGTFALSAIIHGDGFREIDNPSRVLLFLPLLLLFREFPINLKTVLLAIPLGSIISGIVAFYQKFHLNLDKPFPYLMSIQAGDIAISLGTISLAIAIYWGIKKEYKWLVFSLVGAGFGMLSSALTGSRGGWVGLPLVLVIILFFSYKNLNRKVISSVTLLLLAIISAIIFIPQTKVLNRINDAAQEISNYFEKNHRHTSLGTRFDMWNGVFLGIQEKPVLGWGSQGYIELKQRQVKEKKMHNRTLLFNDAHNQILDALIKRGIIGVLGVLAIILVPLFYFIRQIKKSTIEIKVIALLGIVHIISVCGFFTSQTFLAHNSGTLFYCFVLMILYGLGKSVKS